LIAGKGPKQQEREYGGDRNTDNGFHHSSSSIRFIGFIIPRIMTKESERTSPPKTDNKPKQIPNDKQKGKNIPNDKPVEREPPQLRPMKAFDHMSEELQGRKMDKQVDKKKP
jgi:hypothetical protein